MKNAVNPSYLPLNLIASDLSEIGEELRTDDGISRTSGSSSIDPNENGPADDTSSIHAVSSQGGNQVNCV